MGRVSTGIRELDKMLSGGFMQGDAVMVAGSAGTGKTTLALQCLFNGITKFDENGIYVTFEQMPDQIYRDAKNFGWDLPKLERNGKFKLICTTPSLLLESGGLDIILGEPIRELRPKRIVIDSLTHLEMFVPPNEIRKEAYRLIMYLKTKGLNSILVWESSQSMGQAATLALTEHGLSFLVDCIIMLRSVEIESAVKKALVILKMRGSNHDKQLREFDITNEGIDIKAPFTKYEGLFTGSPRKTGIEEVAKVWSKNFGENR